MFLLGLFDLKGRMVGLVSQYKHGMGDCTSKVDTVLDSNLLKDCTAR